MPLLGHRAVLDSPRRSKGQSMSSIAWTATVVSLWFILNLLGTVLNQTKNTYARFIWMEQAGDVPMQSSTSNRPSGVRTRLGTSRQLVIHRPKWLKAPVRAVNNMRAQAPYLAALMALAWWIERMPFSN